MKSRGKTFSEINITPLTDVFLVLLIIMMVTAPMIDIKGLDLAVLTVGPNTDPSEKPKTILVEINSQGEYTVDHENIKHDELEGVLQKKSAENPDGVVIEVNPETTHQDAAYAIAAAKRAGVTKLALMAKEVEKKSNATPPPAHKHSKKGE